MSIARETMVDSANPLPVVVQRARRSAEWLGE